MHYVFMTRIKSYDTNNFVDTIKTPDGRIFPKDVSSSLTKINNNFVNSALYSNIPYNNVFASTTEEPFSYDISVGPFENKTKAEIWAKHLQSYGYFDADTYEYEVGPDDRIDLVLINY